MTVFSYLRIIWFFLTLKLHIFSPWLYFRFLLFLCFFFFLSSNALSNINICRQLSAYIVYFKLVFYVAFHHSIEIYTTLYMQSNPKHVMWQITNHLYILVRPGRNPGEQIFHVSNTLYKFHTQLFFQLSLSNLLCMISLDVIHEKWMFWVSDIKFTGNHVTRLSSTQ